MTDIRCQICNDPSTLWLKPDAADCTAASHLEREVCECCCIDCGEARSEAVRLKKGQQCHHCKEYEGVLGGLSNYRWLDLDGHWTSALLCLNCWLETGHRLRIARSGR